MKRLVVLSIALLIGCGGGGNGHDSQTESATANYVDSPVSGIEYECGNIHGITDVQGKFVFERSKGCVFKIGNIVLKRISPQALENGKVIFETSPLNASLLQTLDNDADPLNGITIQEKVRNVLKKITVKNLDDSNIEKIYEYIKNTEGYNGKFYSKTEALLNLIKSQTVFIKNLISGKKLYVVSCTEEGVRINETEVNANADSMMNEDGRIIDINIAGSSIVMENNKTGQIIPYKNKIKIIYQENGLPVYSSNIFFDLLEAEEFKNNLISGKYIKSLIAGKVFYQFIKSPDGKLVLNRIIIDKNATSGMFNVVDGSRLGGSFSIKINGNKLLIHIDGMDKDYSVEYLGRTGKMLIFAPSRNEINITSYMFFDESYARNLLEKELN